MKPDKNYRGKANVTFGKTLDGSLQNSFLDNEVKDVHIVFETNDSLYVLNCNYNEYVDSNEDDDHILCHYYYNKKYDLFSSSNCNMWNSIIRINYLISETI